MELFVLFFYGMIYNELCQFFGILFAVMLILLLLNLKWKWKPLWYILSTISILGAFYSISYIIMIGDWDTIIHIPVFIIFCVFLFTSVSRILVEK